ncbi:MAG: chemotaxis protein CheD [Planctomycetota bacterium]
MIGIEAGNKIMLGVGELAATGKPGGVLRTLALGSCVAVIFLDPETRTVGMVHIALSYSSIHPDHAKSHPGYFADTGIPALMKAMVQAGADRNYRKWIVKLVGGANVADPSNIFNIGKKNALAIKKVLWHFRMGAKAIDLGKNISRSVSADVDNGTVVITSPGLEPWMI